MLTIPEATLIIDKAFEKVVGQEKAKMKIKRMLLAAINDNGFLPPLLLIGEPGSGKSLMLKIYAGLIRAVLSRSPLFFKTGEACGTKRLFVENVLIPYFNDKDAGLFVDECHEAQAGILRLFRDMLNPTNDRADHTIQAHGDYELTWQWGKHTMALGTNKIDKLDSALISRFQRVDMELYTDEEMEQILFDAIKGENIQFNDNTLGTLAACNRGSARDIVHWCNAIREHVALKTANGGRKQLSKDDVSEIIRVRQTYMLGVTANELRSLLMLEKHGPQQLKELAAKNHVEPKEQNANEKYLLLRGLLAIEGRRHLTAAGMAFLESMRKAKLIPRVAAVAELAA